MQERTPIYDSDDAGTLHDRLMTMGSGLVLKTIEGIADGTLQATAQTVPDGDIPGAPKIFRDTCKIDWAQEGEKVQNFIRGLSPYPAAFTTVEEQGEEVQLKIYETTFEKNGKNEVGNILSDGKTFLKIGVTDGFIAIKSLQMSGKKRNCIKNFLIGHNITHWKLNK